ncbi:MAG TPA: DUF4190 domain-containing protein [Actinoplanes sp.]|nr:DUF4190 domain-containing protein [Actinoplanes sp.]
MAPTRTNGWAIGALVISICGGVGIGTVLGFVFGLIALREIRRQPQKGRGLAIAALVISSLTAVLLLVGVGYGSTEEIRKSRAGIEDVDVTALKKGDCINEFDTTVRLYDVPVVACTQPHEAEVYLTFTFPTGPFPGVTAVEKQSEEACLQAFTPYDTTENADLDVYYLYPQNTGDWTKDRSVTCLAVDPSGTRTTPLTR